MNLFKSKKGFIALTEMVVILSIVTILTAIAVPSYLIAKRRARVAQALSDMGNIIAPGCHQFKIDVWTRYPASTDKELYGLGLTNPFKNTDDEYTRWAGPYIKFNFKDPWGQDYIIIGDGVNLCMIASSGKNRKWEIDTSNDTTNRPDKDTGKFFPGDKTKDDLGVVVYERK